MNVSEEHLMVLLLAKNCGERFFADYFGNFGFCYNDKPLHQKNFAGLLQNSKKYENYTKIVCVDNPYFLVYKEFLLNSKENWKLKKNSLQMQQEHFSFWFNNIFYNNLHFLNQDHNNYQVLFLKSEQLSTFHFDFLIKRENFFEGLQNLPFFDAKKINSNLEFLMREDLTYQNVINIEQAKQIYDFFKGFFTKFDYNPFSFTSQELTKKEKVDFIHS